MKQKLRLLQLHLMDESLILGPRKFFPGRF
jgi:hypothetical protein